MWNVTSRDQYRAVDELIERATPNANYYALLVLSSLVITAGILMGNNPIVIGGMLITPLLTPILVIALGITAGKPRVSASSARLVFQSLLFVALGAFVMGLLFGQPATDMNLDDSMRTTLLYLIVALVSGIAATYAWIKKEAFEALPGVAIAVSLVPPVSYIGVSLAAANWDMARTFFVILVVNILGIIAGSMVVFSQFGFYRTRGLVELKAEAKEKELKEAKTKEATAKEEVLEL